MLPTNIPTSSSAINFSGYKLFGDVGSFGLSALYAEKLSTSPTSPNSFNPLNYRHLTRGMFVGNIAHEIPNIPNFQNRPRPRERTWSHLYVSCPISPPTRSPSKERSRQLRGVTRRICCERAEPSPRRRSINHVLRKMFSSLTFLGCSRRLATRPP